MDGSGRRKRRSILVLICGLAAVMAMGESPDRAEADRLAEAIKARVAQATQFTDASTTTVGVTAFESLATPSSWEEIWPEGTGELTRTVEARLWNAPIRASLDKHGSVYLPKRDKPYHISEPIVLKSGQRIKADPEAEIRLIPKSNTCMVRNANVVDGKNKPVPEEAPFDTGILIEGGIWNTLSTRRGLLNGNGKGWINRGDSSISANGVILLSRVRGAVVRNLTMRQTGLHGIQISACRDFRVEGIIFDEHRQDGVHIDGPTSYGVVRDIRGVTWDDFVALIGWGWKGLDPTYGQIDHVLVEAIDGTSQRAMRLLPGTKTFDNGVKLPCPIVDCVFRDIRNIKSFSVYDQPPVWGQETDCCDPIGTVSNVYFKGLAFDRPTHFRIALHVDGFSIDDVRLNFNPGPDYRLVEFGAMSATAKRKPDDPSTWVDVYNPNADFTVRRFRLSNVRVKTAEGVRELPDPHTRLVRVTNQKLNPDYPRTTPRGGTGKAIFLDGGDR
ncbi:MAG: hypothetical protein PHR35_02625 [Kiritimatiellae bacterium]|nr:hypothetical protein [Kiritimatiellia bacterium]